MSIPRIQKMVPYYHADKFVSLSAHESLVSTANYLDKLESNTILQPIIQSEIIKESTLNLYIPKYKREEAIIKGVYGAFEWDDDSPDQENLIQRNTFKEKIAKSYYSIFIDNLPLKNLDYQYRRRLYNNREGFQVFINIENLSQGSHTLKIESLYKNTDNITFRRSIPFYKLNK